ncbi:MAG: hypothetical protein ABDH23_05685 [Endomicrobiia bacterium]
MKKSSKKTSSKSKKQKQKYVCEKCGLIISVDETCGCVDACDIICCGEQMKPKK